MVTCARPTSDDRYLVELDDCPCTGRHLDRFIQAASLAALDAGPLHGYAMLEQLKATPMFDGHPPDSTGVYRVLNTMEERGLVVSQWDTTGSGPAKKLFCLTDSGRDCLARWLVTLHDHHARLGALIAALQDTVDRAKR